jgi:hypothetical protein
MRRTLRGACHCGLVTVEFETERPEDLPVRACQCSFCRRHGARTVADPEGRLTIRAEPGSLNRYGFGLRTADFLLCACCGTYVAAVVTANGASRATLNAAGTLLAGFETRPAEPVSYDGETAEARIARRLGAWTPTEFAFDQAERRPAGARHAGGSI